jgi:Uma2 family endonuclease
VVPAPLDWRVSETEQWQPDLVVVRIADLRPERLEVVPVLAVEVVSPSTRRVDFVLKRAAYERAGLPHYWLVDPDGPALTALALRGGANEVVVDAATGTIELTEPFAVTIAVAALIEA